MTIKDELGNKYLIDKVVGTGGQGAVYFVENNKRIVIKVKTTANGEILKNHKAYRSYKDKIFDVMAKSAIAKLASPICMLEEPYCGYVMRFMEDMEPIEKIMLPQGDDLKNIGKFYSRTGGLKRRYAVLRGIARVMTDMYNNGLVYSDISPKNIFISRDKWEFETWLIDVDNLHYAGEQSSSIGTPMYRAPEVFAGEPNTMESDVYSFALLAFELLTLSKPFEGGYQEEEEFDDSGVGDFSDADDCYSKMERGDLPFVGEEMTLNPQISGIPFAMVTTKAIRQLFRQTFGTGKKNPALRPTISAWLEALNIAYDSLSWKDCHAHFGRKCFLCGQNSIKYQAKIFQYKYVSEKDDVVKIVRKLNFVVELSEKETNYSLSRYLFSPYCMTQDNKGIEIQKKGKSYNIFSRFESIVKLRHNGRRNSIDGMKIYIEKNGMIESEIQIVKEEDDDEI